MDDQDKQDNRCPLTVEKVVDLYFLEHRAKLIDIAAFLDRVDRAAGAAVDNDGDNDFRLAAFRRALELLRDGEGDRARRVLEILSDPTDEPLVSSDFNHDSHSSVFHMDQTKVMDGTFCRVMSWYDNEWGFSNRMGDTAVAMGALV